MWFLDKFDEQYEKYEQCKKDVEQSIKEKGEYKFDKNDKCYNFINKGSFNYEYRHKFIMELGELVKGKIVNFETPEYRKCVDNMKDQVLKYGSIMYYNGHECHDELFKYQTSKYKNTKISDKISDWKPGYEKITYKYIGFTISKV